MMAAEILLSVLLSELVGLFLLLMFVLGAIIVEKVVDVKSLRLRVSRVKELEEKNGTLYEETETLRRNVEEYKQLAIKYQREMDKAREEQKETVERILDLVKSCGYSAPTDDEERGYNGALCDVVGKIKIVFGGESDDVH